MRFPSLILSVMLLLATMTAPLSLTASSSACGGAIVAADECSSLEAERSRNNKAERLTVSCVTCRAPRHTALPVHEPGETRIAFARTARLLVSRSDGPPRRPPRVVS